MESVCRIEITGWHWLSGLTRDSLAERVWPIALNARDGPEVKSEMNECRPRRVWHARVRGVEQITGGRHPLSGKAETAEITIHDVASRGLKKLLSGAFLSHLLRFGAAPQNCTLLAYVL